MSSGWLPSAARAIVRRPVLTLVLLLLALSPALVALGGVKPNNSLDAWFIAGDPALAQYNEFLREYGNDEAIIVGFDTPKGARSEDERALQRRIAERVEGVDGIERVLVGSDIPPALSTGLVARDESAAAIVAWVSVREDIEAVRGRIIDDVRRVANEELQSGQQVAHLAGNGVLYEGLNQQTLRDTGVFLSLALLAMVGLLGLALRNVRAVALVLIAPLVAAATGMGVLGLSGRPFTVVGSALPTLILVIALTDAIHVLLHYQRRRRADPPATEETRRAQVADAVARMAIPCLYTSLTTAAGFLALATSRISLVRDFGLIAAVGMLLAWIITLVFMAASLTMFDVAPNPRGTVHGVLQRACDVLATRLFQWRMPILLLSAAAAFVLAAGVMRVESDTLTIGLLPEEHVVRHDSEWLERRLGAYTPLEMRITASPLDTAEIGGVAFADRVKEWRMRAEALPAVQRTFSACCHCASVLWRESSGSAEWLTQGAARACERRGHRA